MKKKIILIFISILLIVSTFWATNTFDNLTFNQIIFHIFVPNKGTNLGVIIDYIIKCIPLILLLTLILYHLLKKSNNIYLYVILILSIVLCFYSLGIFKYVFNQFVYSTFLNDNYINPENIEIKFPDKKRNLIYIFLESMEYTYNEYNILDDINKLNDITFFNDSKGAYVLGSATFTTSAMVSHHSGIPIYGNFDKYTFDINNNFLANMTNLGDILDKNSYNNYLMVGSNSLFGGRYNYFKTHGNYEIWDLNNAIHEGYMTSDDVVFWGFSDKELFKYAKDKLNNIKEHPFNLTLLTVNTHNPNGYIDDSCNIKNDDIYAKSILCSNSYLKDFIEWVQNSEFYSNTTIVLAGDHLTMNTSLLKKLPKEYDRTVYFTIINSPLEYNANRLFTTYDIFPTTLASLNVKIEGNRLGLGTNLYSDTKTLLEIYGIEYMNKELFKKSTFYPKLFK